MREPSDDRGDQILAHRRVLRNVETFGHARHRAGQDDVALDVLACAFERDDVVEADDAGLRYRIWHAVRDAVQTTDRRRQHDAAVTGLAHPWKRGTDRKSVV